ncbi:MAG: hypothetical protein L0H84_05600 [Pseudonocardia sp.]|nr:hypothetical protein [Pseudonocardia sp.]
MAMNVGELVAYLSLDDTKYKKTLAAAEKAAKGLGKAVAGSAAGIAGLGAGVQVIGGLAGVLGAAAGALPVLAAGAVAAKFGMAALSVATDGFGDAMSSMDDPAAFAQAIAELSPAARDAANAVRDLKPAWDAMTDSVQEKAFAGLAPIISKLGGVYLPILGDSFGRVASAANAAARGVGESLATSARVGDVTAMTGDFASAWENVLAAAQPLVSVLLDVGTVAASFLPSLTSGAQGAAQGFADMVSRMRDSGELYMMMQRGLDTLRKLGEVAGNVGEILGGIFRAADVGGASFIDRLVAITQRIADMVNSVDGQAALSTFFQTAATLSSLFMDALDALLPILPPLVDALGTLAVTLGTALVDALTFLSPYLEAFATFLADNPTLVTTLAVALGGLVIAMNLLLGAAKIVGIVQVLVSSGLFGMLISAGTTAAGWIVSWVMMAAGALASAASMAMAWLIAIGPIALVIAAVVGLVALIIYNWDAIAAWTQKAWAAVVGFVSDAWNNIVQWCTDAINNVVRFISDGWNNAVTMASDAWNNIVNAVRDGANNVLNFVRGLPGQILSALGNLGNLLFSAGRDIVIGLWNGIVGMGSWLWDQIMGWIRSVVPGPILSFLGIASPSKFMRDEIGKWIPEGLADGILANARVAGDAARRLARDTAAGAQAGVSSAFPGAAGMAGDGGAAADILRRGGGPGAGAPGITIQINNPVGERSSDAIGRAGSVLAAVGPWGDE